MTNNPKFTIIENNLTASSDVKSLVAANDSYKITVFYYGEYAEDLAANAVSKYLTTVVCEAKGDNINIRYTSGHIYIDTSLIELIAINHIDGYKNLLDIAKASALALSEMLKEHGFPAEI